MQPPTSDQQLAIVAVLGVAGGLGIALMARKSLQEGLSDDERKGVLGFVVAGLGIWALKRAFDLEDAWWLSVEGTAEKGYEYGKEQLPR